MLEPIAPELWGHSQVLRLPGGVIFHARMTVLRLPSGALVLHSPVSIDDALATALAELGPVRHLVTPNAMHDGFAAAGRARYPDAVLWAPPAFRNASGSSDNPKVPADRWLDDPAVEDAFESVIAVHEIAGAPKISEFVFRHRPTASLIVSDLLFHIDYPTNWITRLVLRMVGAHGGRLAQSRAWRMATRDRAAAGRSIEAVFDADGRAAAPDEARCVRRLIPGHGSVLTADPGREAEFEASILNALWWMRGRVKGDATRALASAS